MLLCMSLGVGVRGGPDVQLTGCGVWWSDHYVQLQQVQQQSSQVCTATVGERIERV